MTQPDRRVEINISGVPVAGVGGLGLVAMAVLVSVYMPAAWWTMVTGLIGGVVLAAILIIARRGLSAGGSGPSDATTLFRAVPAEAPHGKRKPDTEPHTMETRALVAGN